MKKQNHYNNCLNEYGEKLVKLMENFMNTTRPSNYDSSEVKPNLEQAKGILENWLIDLTSNK